jgi:hypothetical protein
MQNIPYSVPPAPEIVDRQRTTIGKFILDKEIGTPDFRANVTDYVSEIQERQNQPKIAAA